MYDLESEYVQATVSDMSSTADQLTLTPAFPIEIISFGYIITTILVKAGAVVAGLDKRVTAGSDTGRVTASYGTLTLTSAQVTSNGATGSVLRSRPASASGAFAGPAPAEAAGVVLPGQQAVLVLSTAATSGAAIAFVEFKPLARRDRATSVELIVSA